MNYNIIWEDELVKLIKKVNECEQMGWKAKGGVSAIRERLSGPVVYIQAVYKPENVQIKRPRGRPRKNDPGNVFPK